MLLRIDDADPGTAPTIEACARAVSDLASRGLVAMVEPLPYERDARRRRCGSAGTRGRSSGPSPSRPRWG